MGTLPSIMHIPAAVHVENWAWEKYATPGPYSKTFFVGTDQCGKQWLTKGRGSFYAYREIVFARLATKFGWSCQVSTFGVFPLRSQVVRELGGPPDEIVHSVHGFLPEHPYGSCGGNCLLRSLVGANAETILCSPIKNILDWPRSEIAACLFGANEPPGRLFTSEHEFVIIDSELMFSTGPSDVTETEWWKVKPEKPYPSGRELTFDVCRRVAALTDVEMNEILSIPRGIKINQQWNVKAILKKARAYADRFIRTSA
jgi:hypothetical protein